jgi:hypothetical protein
MNCSSDASTSALAKPPVRPPRSDQRIAEGFAIGLPPLPDNNLDPAIGVLIASLACVAFWGVLSTALFLLLLKL